MRLRGSVRARLVESEAPEGGRDVVLAKGNRTLIVIAERQQAGVNGWDLTLIVNKMNQGSHQLENEMTT